MERNCGEEEETKVSSHDCIDSPGVRLTTSRF